MHTDDEKFLFWNVQALMKSSNCFVVIETDHNSEVAESVIKAGMQVEEGSFSPM